MVEGRAKSDPQGEETPIFGYLVVSSRHDARFDTERRELLMVLRNM
jgi:hypothetical protein